MQSLEELIAALEKATGPSRELDAQIATLVGGYSYEKRGRDQKAWYYPDGSGGRRQIHGMLHERLPGYTSSIDAAVALVGRVLPGFGWDIASNTSHIKACLNPEFGKPIGKYPHWAAVSNISSKQFEDGATPAIALLIATLRAKLSQEKTNADK